MSIDHFLYMPHTITQRMWVARPEAHSSALNPETTQSGERHKQGIPSVLLI